MMLEAGVLGLRVPRVITRLTPLMRVERDEWWWQVVRRGGRASALRVITHIAGMFFCFLRRWSTREGEFYGDKPNTQWIPKWVFKSCTNNKLLRDLAFNHDVFYSFRAIIRSSQISQKTRSNPFLIGNSMSLYVSDQNAINSVFLNNKPSPSKRRSLCFSKHRKKYSNLSKVQITFTIHLNQWRSIYFYNRIMCLKLSKHQKYFTIHLIQYDKIFYITHTVLKRSPAPSLKRQEHINTTLQNI